MTETQAHPDPKMRWRNMRRMAYTALWCAIIETLILLVALMVALDGDSKVTVDAFHASGAWLIASYMLWGGIIGAYMGVSGTADAWGFKQ